jgi:hypothetical protein
LKSGGKIGRDLAPVHTYCMTVAQRQQHHHKGRANTMRIVTFSGGCFIKDGPLNSKDFESAEVSIEKKELFIKVSSTSVRKIKRRRLLSVHVTDDKARNTQSIELRSHVDDRPEHPTEIRLIRSAKDPSADALIEKLTSWTDHDAKETGNRSTQVQRRPLNHNRKIDTDIRYNKPISSRKQFRPLELVTNNARPSYQHHSSESNRSFADLIERTSSPRPSRIPAARVSTPTSTARSNRTIADFIERTSPARLSPIPAARASSPSSTAKSSRSFVDFIQRTSSPRPSRIPAARASTPTIAAGRISLSPATRALNMDTMTDAAPDQPPEKLHSLFSAAARSATKRPRGKFGMLGQQSPYFATNQIRDIWKERFSDDDADTEPAVSSKASAAPPQGPASTAFDEVDDLVDSEDDAFSPVKTMQPKSTARRKKLKRVVLDDDNDIELGKGHQDEPQLSSTEQFRSTTTAAARRVVTPKLTAYDLIRDRNRSSTTTLSHADEPEVDLDENLLGLSNERPVNQPDISRFFARKTSTGPSQPKKPVDTRIASPPRPSEFPPLRSPATPTKARSVEKTRTSRSSLTPTRHNHHLMRQHANTPAWMASRSTSIQSPQARRSLELNLPFVPTTTKSSYDDLEDELLVAPPLAGPGSVQALSLPPSPEIYQSERENDTANCFTPPRINPSASTAVGFFRGLRK